MPPEIENLEIRSFSRRQEREPGQPLRVTHLNGMAGVAPDLSAEDRDAAIALLGDALQAEAGPGTFSVNTEAPWIHVWFEYRADPLA